MARTFSEEDFVAPTQPAPTAGRSFSAADFGDEGEALPEYANGLAPDTAINESPVSLEDRAKLSVGNAKGKAEFLKKYYGEVQTTKSGDFVVKNKANGLWQRVDPENLGDGDPWKMTKELLADAIDIVPTGINIGTQIGAAALMTPVTVASGGTALPVQLAVSGAIGGALSATETSLGRLAGTYSGTIEDQTKDAAIETLMSLGGTAIAAGVKPTMQLISRNLSKAVKAIGIDGTTKQAVANLVGLSVKGGPKSVERLIENTDEVANFMNKAAAGGKSGDDAINALKVDNVFDTKDIASNVRPALTEFYERGANEVVDSVDNTFAVNFKEDLKPMVEVFRQKDMLAQAAEEGAPLRIKSFEQYVKDVQKSGVVTDMINDKKSYDLMADMFNEIKRYDGFGQQRGKLAARNLMNFRRNIFDKSFELQTAADDLGLVPAQRMLASLKGMGDDAVYSKFQLKEPASSALLGNTDNLFSSLNKQYASLSNQFKPLLRTVKNAETSGDAAYEGLYNKISAAAGRNSVLKSEFDNAVDLVANYSKTGKELARKYENIKSRDAAMAFIPNLKPGLISSISVPGAAVSAATGNLAVAVPMAATAAITSPKLNYKVIKGMLKANALVKSLKPEDRMKLLQTPQAFNSLYGTILERPALENQIKSQLIQQGVKAVKGQEGQ